MLTVKAAFAQVFVAATSIQFNGLATSDVNKHQTFKVKHMVFKAKLIIKYLTS